VPASGEISFAEDIDRSAAAATNRSKVLIQAGIRAIISAS